MSDPTITLESELEDFAPRPDTCRAVIAEVKELRSRLDSAIQNGRLRDVARANAVRECAELSSRLDIGEKELARVVGIKNQALADFAALRVERDAIASRLDAACDAWRKMMTDGSPADERQAAKWELLAALQGGIVERQEIKDGR